jgi:hypothetical protein
MATPARGSDRNAIAIAIASPTLNSNSNPEIQGFEI